MRQVTLMCKQHPELRWTCKSIAFTPGKGWNGQRNIFPQQAEECACSASEMIIATGDPWCKLSEEEQRKAIVEDCK